MRLMALQRDLSCFGRDDVALISVGSLVLFVWDPDFTSAGGAFRRTVIRP
jgi:hypothetical protein